MKSAQLFPLLSFLMALFCNAQGQEIEKLEAASLSTQIRWQNEKPSVLFSWQLIAEGRGQKQKGYRVLLSTASESLKPDGDLIWDSKQTPSPQSIFVAYNGPELEKEKTFYWTVKLTNSDDEQGTWSEPSSFLIPEKREQNKLKPAQKAKPIADFQCSNSTLNKLFKTSISNRKSNLTTPPSFEPKELPTSAPLQLTARGYSFQAELRDYYSHWVQEFRATINEDKTFPTSPNAPQSTEAAPGYSDAALVIPFALWQLNGDSSTVREIFPAAVDHVGVVRKNDTHFSGQAFGKNRGDFGHQNDPTSAEFLSLAFFALDCRILKEMAAEVGHLPYMIQHEAWFKNIQEGFQKSFLDEEGNLTEKSQTAQILALRFGLLPPEAKQPTADKLAARLKKEGLTAGIFGQSAVLPVLSWTGHHEQAVDLAKSFGAEGAEPSEVAVACTSEWMMSFLAGFIHQAPGFKTSRISPFIPEDGSITEVKAHHDTPYGRLAMNWKTNETGLTAEVTIPPNTTGIVSLPGDKEATVTEGGQSLEDAYGCQFMKDTNGRKEIIAQSGTYYFEVKNP